MAKEDPGIAEIERQEYALRPLSPQALRARGAGARPAEGKKKKSAMVRLAKLTQRQKRRGQKYLDMPLEELMQQKI